MLRAVGICKSWCIFMKAKPDAGELLSAVDDFERSVVELCATHGHALIVAAVLLSCCAWWVGWWVHGLVSGWMCRCSYEWVGCGCVGIMPAPLAYSTGRTGSIPVPYVHEA